jgi:hypothetical protein
MGNGGGKKDNARSRLFGSGPGFRAPLSADEIDFAMWETKPALCLASLPRHPSQR